MWAPGKTVLDPICLEPIQVISLQASHIWLRNLLWLDLWKQSTQFFVSTNPPNICPLFSANSPLTAEHFSLQISANFEKKTAQEVQLQSFVSH